MDMDPNQTSATLRIFANDVSNASMNVSGQVVRYVGRILQKTGNNDAYMIEDGQKNQLSVLYEKFED